MHGADSKPAPHRLLVPQKRLLNDSKKYWRSNLTCFARMFVHQRQLERQMTCLKQRHVLPSGIAEICNAGRVHVLFFAHHDEAHSWRN